MDKETTLDDNDKGDGTEASWLGKVESEVNIEILEAGEATLMLRRSSRQGATPKKNSDFSTGRDLN